MREVAVVGLKVLIEDRFFVAVEVGRFAVFINVKNDDVEQEVLIVVCD